MEGDGGNIALSDLETALASALNGTTFHVVVGSCRENNLKLNRGDGDNIALSDLETDLASALNGIML